MRFDVERICLNTGHAAHLCVAASPPKGSQPSLNVLLAELYLGPLTACADRPMYACACSIATRKCISSAGSCPTVLLDVIDLYSRETLMQRFDALPVQERLPQRCVSVDRWHRVSGFAAGRAAVDLCCATCDVKLAGTPLGSRSAVAYRRLLLSVGTGDCHRCALLCV